MNNLNNIHTATLKQSELAIPTLKGSNSLALEISKMSYVTLQGYYQSDLQVLATNLNKYKSTKNQLIIVVVI